MSMVIAGRSRPMEAYFYRPKKISPRREAAHRVIDLCIEMATSIHADAGWHSIGTMGAISDFHGQIPGSSGFSGFSRVYEATRFLRHWSADHLSAYALFTKIPEIYQEALLWDRAYRGKPMAYIDPYSNELVEARWSTDRVAATLGLNPGTYRRRVHEGYLKLEEILPDGRN